MEVFLPAVTLTTNTRPRNATKSFTDIAGDDTESKRQRVGYRWLSTLVLTCRTSDQQHVHWSISMICEFANCFRSHYAFLKVGYVQYMHTTSSILCKYALYFYRFGLYIRLLRCLLCQLIGGKGSRAITSLRFFFLFPSSLRVWARWAFFLVTPFICGLKHYFLCHCTLCNMYYYVPIPMFM